MTAKKSLPGSGDAQEQVAEIYEKYGADMEKVARIKLRDRPNAEYDAQEAVQNAFIRIIENGEYVRCKSEEKMHEYLMMLVAGEVAKIQSKTGEPETCEFSEEYGKEEDFFTRLISQNQSDQVMNAMMKLKTRYRTVLTLRYVEELTVREISERLNMKIKTVYTNIRRGKRLLLCQLEKESIE